MPERPPHAPRPPHPTPNAPQPAPSVSKWIVLAVAGSGTYMTTLDAGMTSVALPTITQRFDAPVVVTQWVVLAYLLCITGLLLPMGRIADMIGRKRVFLTGFVIFVLGSALAGLAPSLTVLIVSRVIQGIGGAMMQANGSGLVAQAFPTEQRGQALGLNSAIVAAGNLSGPMVGGFLIDWLGWQWVFFVNLPIGLVATLFGLRQLRETTPRPGQCFDLAGAILFLAMVSGLLLTLNQGGQVGWHTPAIWLLAAGTLAVGAIFALVERRTVQPIIEMALFRLAGFRAAILSAFLMFLTISHTRLLMPFYLQLVLGLSPGQVGLVLVSQPAALLVLAPLSGSLSDRFGSRLLASTGAAIAAAGTLSLALLSPASHLTDVVIRLVVLAIGMALFNSPNTSALFGSLPRERYGVAGAYQSLTRNLGQSIGQVLAAVIWTAVVTAAAGGAPVVSAPPQALTAGFQAALGLAATLATGAAVVSLVARPRGGNASRPTDRPAA